MSDGLVPMLSLRFRIATVVVATSLSISSVRAEERGAAPEAAPVRLRATQPDATFYVQASEKDLFNARFMGGGGGRISVHLFDELCAPPCEVRLPEGDYVLGMTLDHSRILESRHVYLRGGETLTGTWVSRRALRVGGAIVGGAAVLAGFILATRSLNRCSDGTMCHETPRLWIGLGLVLGGAAFGLTTQLLEDRAEIEGVPLE